MIYSVTGAMGPNGRMLFIKQVTWCCLGVATMAALIFVDYHLIERWAGPFFLIIVIALVFVWGFGKVTSGSRRWMDLGFMRVQPSEFAKLAVVIFLARHYQDTPAADSDIISGIVKPGFICAIPIGLVLVEPDLGTSGVIFLISASIILFAAGSKRALIWISGAIALLAPILYFLGDRLLLDYQKRRLLTFIDPGADPLGAGYHITQSQIAIGSGGMFGKGFLEGTQNQLMFLPVKHTDFIFSILAEEFGFVGCALALLLFTALFVRGLTIAGESRDKFGAILAFGCVSLLFWHVIINVAMVSGLAPVVGAPLSFMSYGGSSLVVSFMSVALIANVAMRRRAY
jgi:rod shape determining protein RodA